MILSDLTDQLTKQYNDAVGKTTTVEEEEVKLLLDEHFDDPEIHYVYVDYVIPTVINYDPIYGLYTPEEEAAMNWKDD